MQPKIYSINLATHLCTCWSRTTSVCCLENKSGRFSARLFVSFRLKLPSLFGGAVGKIRDESLKCLAGFLFLLKLSQRGKIFREFAYCQRFRCVQNKSLDASKTASFGPLTFMTRASTQGPNGMEIRSNLSQLVLTVGR